MNRVLILIGLGILVLVLIRIYGRHVMGFEGFSSSPELLIVKASWCGHCKTAMPEFKKLVASSPFKLADGNSVTIRMLDEADNKDEVAQLPVKGFPTILFRNGATPIEYSGPRTYDGVMGFLKGM